MQSPSAFGRGGGLREKEQTVETEEMLIWVMIAMFMLLAFLSTIDRRPK